MFSTTAIGILYILLSRKLETTVLQIRMLTKQNRELTTKMNILTKPSDNIKIYYHALPSFSGEITTRCPLFLCPIYNSQVLRNISTNTKVELLDLVEVQDTLWYEVKIISNENFNLKGYVKKEFIRELQSVETAVMYR